jgi:riboflavin biosynthesis pyrimidine reductase
VEVVWYTAASIDGRIADGNESLEFLDMIGEREGSETEFPEFIAGIDALLMGAQTLRWLVGQGHALPHRGLPIWLLTHDGDLAAAAVAADAETPVHPVEGEIVPVLDAIAAAGHRRTWLCGGGDVAAQAVAADRLDEVIVTIAPAVLGAGPSLFDGADLPQRRFKLVECTAVGGEAARLRWERERG